MASLSPPGAKVAALNFCTPQPIVTITVSSTQSKDLAKSQRESLTERCQSKINQRLGTTDSSSDTQALAKQESATTKFQIHKNLLCQNSCFFTAAFNGNFKEGATQSMVLDDVDADTFGVVVNWIYTQKISDVSNLVPSLCALAKVWILAERFLMPTLQNVVMDHIYLRLKNGAPTSRQVGEFAQIAYGHGDGEHALGKVMQAVLTWCSAEELFHCADTLPNKLVFQMMMIFKNFQWDEIRKLVPVVNTFYVAVDEK